MQDQRPFRILGVQQIAIGAEDRASLHHLWVHLLGAHQESTFVSEKENVEEDILSIGNGTSRVEIDLMQPLDPDAKPAVHRPPLNHFGLWVDDLAKAYDWLSERGVRFTPGGIRPGAAGHDVCFIHPKGNEDSPVSGSGVLIELVQAPPDLIESVPGSGND